LVPLAATDNRVTTAIIVSVAIVAFFGFLVVTAVGGPRRRKGEVPAGFRPGPSDTELERSVLDRYIGWGAVSIVFMAVFLPVYWLREPTRLSLKENQFLRESVVRGEEIFGPAGSSLTALGCAECHGNEGAGGQRTFTMVDRRTGQPREVPYAEPPLRLAVARYTAAGRSPEDIKQLLRDAIERGRPGTPMPTWGLTFGGPLNSQAIDDLMNYITSVQVGVAPLNAPINGRALFEANCAICHGTDDTRTPQNELATGGVGPNLTIEFQRNAERQIFDTIKKGRLNLDRPSMPAWAHLGDEAVQALVNFIRSIQAAGTSGA
jgi:mono/diheme cytochrome c family protein